MPTELPKSYDPASVQAEVARVWDDEKCFHAEPTDPGEPYSIVIPPPNVTAALHLGHALNNTLQDVLIRRARMQGKNTCWLPGTDHAGIATQTVVEKRVLKEEGRRRTDFERDEFVAKIQAWKDEYEKVILGQLKAMGCSCDWDRTAFTMDEPRAKAVREAFFQLFKAGLIYRGKRLVNWDPVTLTALADDEVENEEIDGHFYYLKYPLCTPTGELTSVSGQSTITVATTRPETMLGDTAVAINPTDPRATALRGLFVLLPIVNRVIPIIEDDYVVKPVQYGGDPADAKAQLATGFLKVTPAHDPNDYDIGRRHSLPIINVMAPDASISDKHGWTDIGDAGFLLGKSREEARKLVVMWFKDNGLLEDQKPYRHSVGHSYRSHVPIEPYLSDQWYCRVTDDRLAGAALRAMSPAQQSNTNNEPRPLGSGLPAPAGSPPYFVTFTTYGQHLHGNEHGSVDRLNNLPGTPYLPADADRETDERDLQAGAAFALTTPAHRAAVQDAIIEVCAHRGWRLLVLHVRTTHLHTIVEANATPEKVMGDFKSYATRKLRERHLVEADTRVWTRHGSTRYLNYTAGVEAARNYVIDEQGEPLEPAPIDALRETPARAGVPLPDGRGSSSRLTFYPERYAKTYQTWHENIRDWCISRQLWWGHRIPVWTRKRPEGENYSVEQTRNYIRTHVMAGIFSAPDADAAIEKFAFLHDDDYMHLCIADAEVEAKMKESMGLLGYAQDVDVLDTWFSSGLWPLSTLGWPGEQSQRAATVRERSSDAAGVGGAEGERSLTVAARGESNSPLARWNPTSVLCTAREIITLWVSRMVMFNEFFLGQIPFKHVFVHAMIQDGEGRKMSKSLGNGVDPLDIISSHGTDAMRFTLTSMATNTQDVRMPVEKDPTTGKNTSPKFDLGRNLCNKMWNAARFALSQIEGAKVGESASRQVGESLSTIDRWILSRFNRTVSECDEALSAYRFDQYARACYDFFWRDFCDWYVEAAKVQFRDAARKTSTAHVIASVLDGSLRLMHPMTPFVTEKLWWTLNEIYPDRGIDGWINRAVNARRAHAGDMGMSDRIIIAQWPTVGATDESSEAIMSHLQELVTAIRVARNDYKVNPKQVVNVTIVAPDCGAKQIAIHRDMVESLATCKIAAIVDSMPTAPANSIKAPAGACEVYIEGLVDADAEKQRVAKRREELTKSIAALKGRLGNQGYIAKAPPHLVKQTQDQLAAQEKELAELG